MNQLKHYSPEQVSTEAGDRHCARWIRWAGYASVAGFAVLLAVLARPGLPGRADPFFSILSEGDRFAPSVQAKVLLPFRLIGVRDGISTHGMDFEASAELLSSPTIGLLMFTWMNSAGVVSGRMDFRDPSTGQTTGKYKIRPGTLLRDNRKLEFVKRKSSPAGHPSGSQHVSIKISSRIGPNLAVYGQFSDGEPVSRLLWAPAVSRQGEPGIASIWGWRERPSTEKPVSKADLLAHMWGLGADRGAAIFSLVLCSAGIWLVGVLCLLGGPRPAFGGNGSLALGATFLLLSLGAVLSVIVPPFHAPDEPNHFLTYAARVHQPALAGDAKLLADSGHFERIKFRTDEKFSTSDAAHPANNNWATHVGVTDPNRSPVGIAVWGLAGRFLNKSHAGVALLGLRLVNVAFVAACLGASLALAGSGLAPKGLTAFFAAPAILAPAVAFFSMGVSNYPFLVGADVVQAVALGFLWAQPQDQIGSLRTQVIAAALAGSGLAMAIYSSENGVFGIIFWTVLIPPYWFLRALRARNLQSEFRCAAVFFLVYCFSIAGVWCLVGSWNSSHRFEGILSGVPSAIAGNQLFVLATSTFAMITLSAALVLLGWLSKGANWISGAKRFTVVGVLLGAVLLLFAPSLPTPDYVGSTLSEYLGMVVYAFAEALGPGKPDWMVSRSFWGVFGWLDTPIPQIAIDALRLGTGAGIILLFLSGFINPRGWGGSGMFAITLVALTACVAAIGAGYHLVRFGVHGRYLIGPYLFAMMAASEGYRRAIGAGLGYPSPRVPTGAALCALGISFHSAAWIAVLNRYF